MNGYWVKLLASFLFITLLPACWIAMEIRNSDTDEAAAAAHGVIDLRGRNLLSGGEVRLNGTWMLYPGRLFASTDSAEALSPNQLPIPVDVPGDWNVFPDLGSGLGTATYRLRLLLPEGTDGIYGIRTTNIRTSSRVYVNGEEIAGSGRPGMSRSDTIPGNTPYSGYFLLQGSQTEIVVQVANYSYASGGIIYPIWFGTQEAIARGREFNLFEYWITAGGFLIPALFLLLFFRLRRREAPLLQLGGFCLCGLIFVLTHGEKAALALLPAFDYEWVLRMQLISSSFIYYFLARHVVQLFPKFGVRLLDRIVLGITAAFALAGLTLPTYLFSHWEVLLLLCSLLLIAYVVYVLVRAILTRGEHTIVLAASMQSVLVMLAVYQLYGLGKLEDQTILPFAIIVFSASQAYLIVARFSNLLGHAERLSERLLQLDGVKDEFLLHTSYEIREPLRGIANLAAMQENRQVGGGSEQRLAMIESIALRLSYLVDDIIDFNLLKNGDAQYRHRTVHLQPIVRSVLELYSSQEPSGWALELLPDGLPPLLADERRLGQIVFNLVAYASRHAREGTVRLSAQAENGSVALTIAAPGMGKALETESEKSEFYPADDTAANSAERVRLSVTRRLIELGGGSWRASGPAEGEETLYVSWPAAHSEDAAAQSGMAGKSGAGTVRAGISSEIASAVRDEAEIFRAQAAAATERPRHGENVSSPGSPDIASERAAGGSILIVEGDLLKARVMAHLLSDDHRSIRISTRGAEALELLTDARVYDLVIIDFVMTDISGIELVRRIRKRSMLAELPILLLSEGRLPGESLTGFREGANDILVKPYDTAELQARIGTLLQLRSSIKSLVRTETAFLQAQIKPHFLFNALNTIMSICRINPSQAEELLLELSRYLRASFDFDQLAQRVPLRNELELVRAYLAIESARFGNRLIAEFDIECDDLILVPPLTLQPLVENAVRHGILRKPLGGTVRISVKTAASGWNVAVEDDGVGIPVGRLEEISEIRDGGSGGVGLANISRRLRLMYGEELQIESRPGKGTRVGFMLPGSVKNESDID